MTPLHLQHPLAESLRGFLDEEGRVTRWPQSKSRRRFRAPIMEYFAAHFEPGRTYSEKEVNEVLKGLQTFGDHVLMRREMIDRGLLARSPNGASYWKPGA